MMSIEEEDNRLEFNFGEDVEEFEEIQNLVSQFKRIPQALLERYLSAFAVPKSENTVPLQQIGYSS